MLKKKKAADFKSGINNFQIVYEVIIFMQQSLKYQFPNALDSFHTPWSELHI